MEGRCENPKCKKIEGRCENPDCKKCENPVCKNVFTVKGTGKPRKYCGAACRKKMSREQKTREEQEQRKQEQIQLRARWRELHLDPRVVEILEEILRREENLKIAQLATKAVEILWKCMQKTNERS